MEAANSTIVFEKTPFASKEENGLSVDKETVEILMDHSDEPYYFFKGAIFALILCVPFWAIIFWLIT